MCGFTVVESDFPLYNFHVIVGRMAIPGVHPEFVWERLYNLVSSVGGAVPTVTAWLEEERSSRDSSVCHPCSAGWHRHRSQLLNFRFQEDRRQHGLTVARKGGQDSVCNSPCSTIVPSPFKPWRLSLNDLSCSYFTVNNQVQEMGVSLSC